MSPSVRSINSSNISAKIAITAKALPIFLFHDIILNFLI